ncbi:tRNA pseudouridine synthase-like 1 isoform X4 [Homo sapiens]|uniref:tRNA pseudouridine synthase-like 1 isoform X4 n=1 Tax=Homo sapiens TaxID=9606 RepID=UPI000387CFBF|nr:tRNA pseudouridine synthase-like 1 isoform X4 [Homo sapiens]XP_047300678.1 tRNA pseudouridine synthase-like 1 isoform X3 [Homo sapiens]XP_054190229.1 tRNA pseudouridine synthase-like 1 isoform X3 [Homo sapiens]XP_054190230.1 tRNA pseudouridine synthase-like 1 isoform X4 [Homo sapiens]|eukprot:XP_005244777.1 tRNA pseudouridine synthase-like 1 isoform X2 [Homo sapiens]
MSSAPASGSVRARYLVYFQYVGTDFNGVAAVRGTQRAVGVQNYLEEAAERLNSVEPVRFTISSRTDAGVHALSNAAHLDVQRRSGRPPFPPEVLAEALNTHLRHPAIRVLRAFRVPSDFHARHAATSRTYLYRLATGCHRRDELPVFERNLCWTLPAEKPPSTSSAHTTSAPSSPLAARCRAPCERCAGSPFPQAKPAPWSPPRRAGSCGSGTWSLRASLSCIDRYGG